MERTLVLKSRIIATLAMVALACALVGVAGCSGNQGASTSASASSGAAALTSTASTAEPTTVRVASLKGPTSIGIAQFIAKAEAGKTENDYEFTISGTADEVLPNLIQGTVDIALVPANAAATVYNRTEGAISVIDVNTLGVLYVVSATELSGEGSSDKALDGIDTLAGHTVYMTGAGTTPEYVMKYLLESAGIADDVKLEFKSEATEVAAVLASDPTAIGVLPEPYVTSATLQNPELEVRLSLTDVWDDLQASASKSQLVTGVTVVRNEFADEHPEAVAEFIALQAESVQTINADPIAGGELVVKAQIMENVKAAATAIPRCNLVCLTGSEMQAALSGYLKVLFDQDPASVGGALPADDFYNGNFSV